MGKLENNCDCRAININKCEQAKQAIIDTKHFDKFAEFYKTFADITRLKIICALDSVDSMCVCDIAYALNMTKSAISHQLRYLKENNLVKQEKKGKEVYYTLSDEHVKDIFEIGICHTREML